METTQNPLIGANSLETVQNVTEAFNELLALLANKHSGLTRLMEPMAHALEHAANGTMDGQQRRSE